MRGSSGLHFVALAVRPHIYSTTHFQHQQPVFKIIKEKWHHLTKKITTATSTHKQDQAKTKLPSKV